MKVFLDPRQMARLAAHLVAESGKTHEEVAEELGVTRSVVTRALSYRDNESPAKLQKSRRRIIEHFTNRSFDSHSYMGVELLPGHMPQDVMDEAPFAAHK